MNTTPDLMPLLRKGTGETPADGGCLVQVAGYLADGHSWVDDTPCVHPVLRLLAIVVNDLVSDVVRPRLAVVAPDLIGTGPGPDGVEGRVLAVRLAVWCARQVLDLCPDRGVALAAIVAAEEWADCPCDRHAASAGAAYAAANAYDVGGGVRDAAYAAWDAEAAAYAARAAAYAAWDAEDAAYAAVRAAAYADSGAVSDVRLAGLLTGAVAEHRRLTGHHPPPTDSARWDAICNLIGATA